MFYNTTSQFIKLPWIYYKGIFPVIWFNFCFSFLYNNSFIFLNFPVNVFFLLLENLFLENHMTASILRHSCQYSSWFYCRCWFQFFSLFLILVTYFSSFSILSFLHKQLNQRHIHTLLLLTNFILSFGCNQSILVLIKNKNLKEIMMRYNLQRQIEISRSKIMNFRNWFCLFLVLFLILLSVEETLWSMKYRTWKLGSETCNFYRLKIIKYTLSQWMRITAQMKILESH